jgi:hypothetical protein
LPQAHLDPRCGADALALDDAEIVARGFKVRAHDQEPVHALRLRAQQFDATPLREGGKR